MGLVTNMRQRGLREAADSSWADIPIFTVGVIGVLGLVTVKRKVLVLG